MTTQTYLDLAFANEKLPHALLLTGPDSLEKRAFALNLAQRIQGKEDSFDLHHFEPDSKSGFYSIELIRQVIEQACEAPFSAPKKVFLFQSAEKIVSPSAHALLKTLEEPPLDTVFLLLARQKGDMLPTLASRCTELYFPGQERPSECKGLFEALATQQMPTEEIATGESMVREILGYFRDQEARRYKIPLLYPEAPPATYPPPSLDKIETLLTEMEDALSRQIKPAVCLEHFLSEMISKF